MLYHLEEVLLPEDSSEGKSLILNIDMDDKSDNPEKEVENNQSCCSICCDGCCKCCKGFCACLEHCCKGCCKCYNCLVQCFLKLLPVVVILFVLFYLGVVHI